MAQVAAAPAPANTPKTRTKKGYGTDLWSFANDAAKDTMIRIPKGRKLTKKKREEFVGSIALLAVLESEKFSPASHLCALITGFDAKKKKFIVQPFNRSGDRDGAPQCEASNDLYIFPSNGEDVQVNGVDLTLQDICVATSSIDLVNPEENSTEEVKNKSSGDTRSAGPRRKKMVARKFKANERRERRREAKAKAKRKGRHEESGEQVTENEEDDGGVEEVKKTMRKRKRNREALQKSNHDEALQKKNKAHRRFTVEKVLAAFGDPRGNIIAVHICESYIKLIY